MSCVKSTGAQALVKPTGVHTVAMAVGILHSGREMGLNSQNSMSRWGFTVESRMGVVDGK